MRTFLLIFLKLKTRNGIFVFQKKCEYFFKTLIRIKSYVLFKLVTKTSIFRIKDIKYEPQFFKFMVFKYINKIKSERLIKFSIIILYFMYCVINNSLKIEQ